MFLESFLHAHSFLNIFLDSLICFNELGQQSYYFFDFLLRDDNHTIRGITEDKIPRLDDSAVDV
jgi:hypothetical protein